MILEGIIQIFASVSGWIAGLFPPLEIPAWVSDSVTNVSGFLGSASGLGAWFPMEFLGIVVGGLVAWYVGMFAIRLLLKIWSVLPFGGGS